MERYKNGSETRALIIRTCQELFYEKGFSATTYSDICVAAHVNRGLISYYFGSKETLKGIVFQTESDKICRQVAELRPPVNSFEESFLYTYLYWYKFFFDGKYRRFFSEIFQIQNKFDLYSVEQYYLCSSLSELSPEAELNLALFSNLQAMLSGYVSEHIVRFDYKQVAEFEIRSTFSNNPNSVRRMSSIIDRMRQYIDAIGLDRFDSTFAPQLYKPGAEPCIPLDAYRAAQEPQEQRKKISLVEAAQESKNVSAPQTRADALVQFCAVPRSRAELQAFAGLRSREHFRRHILLPLLQTGRLRMTEPDNPNSRNQRYVRA